MNIFGTCLTANVRDEIIRRLSAPLELKSQPERLVPSGCYRSTLSGVWLDEIRKRYPKTDVPLHLLQSIIGATDSLKPSRT